MELMLKSEFAELLLGSHCLLKTKEKCWPESVDDSHSEIVDLVND